MPTLLKVIGGIWFVMGIWILWRTVAPLSVAALSRVNEAVRPVGSPLVSEQVLSTALVFLLPGLAALVLGGWFSGRRVS